MASQVNHQDPVPSGTTLPPQKVTALHTDQPPTTSHSNALKIDTNPTQPNPSAQTKSTLPTPIHPPNPLSDTDYTSPGRPKSRSRSRRRRNPRRRQNSSIESQQQPPPPPFNPFHKEINTTVPSGSSSSTFELPYHPALQQFQANSSSKQQLRQQQEQYQQYQQHRYPPHDTTTSPHPNNSNTALGDAAQNARQPQQSLLAASPTAPQAEHPIQVPVRVVNPNDLLPNSSAADSKPGSGAAGQGGNLRLRLDLNLDVEVTLKATIRGDLTLALLN